MTVQSVSVDFITRYQRSGLKAFQRDMDSMSGSMRKMQVGTSQSLTGVGRAAKAAGTALLLGVGAALAVGIKAAIDFEDAFAGVRKTVDATEPEFQVLAEAIRAMALNIPVTAVELAKIMELGGQLGVPVQGLEEFTEVVAKLGVTTNLELEDAATLMARFANVMGSSEDDFDNIASALVDLGNNVAAQEDEILAFATRLAGVGSVVGASEGDILGLAAAFTALGVPAERGATALQRIFIEMLESVENGTGKLHTFAEVAGMTVDEFTRLFQLDPVEAFIAFEKGLSEISLAGGSVTGTLDDLGISGQRVLEVLLKGAGGWRSLLTEVNRGNHAFQENIALNEESAERFGTMRSVLKLLFNSFTDLRIELGNRAEPAFRDILAVLAGFMEVINENIDVLQGFAVLIGVIAGAKGLALLGSALGRLLLNFSSTATAGIKLLDMLGGFRGGILFMSKAVAIAAIALGGLALAMGINRARAKENAVAIGELADRVEELKAGASNMEEVRDAFIAAIKQGDAIFDVTLDLDAYRDFLLGLGTTTGELIDLAITDMEGFEKVTSDIIERLTKERDELLPDLPAGNVEPGQVAVAQIVPPEQLEALRIANERLHNFKQIVEEVTTATAQLRAEEERRRKETQTEAYGDDFIDPIARALLEGGGRVGPDIVSGFAGTRDEYLDTLDAMFEGTAEFGDNFLDQWAEVVQGVQDALFDFDTAFDEFEVTTKFNLGKLTTSFENWVTEQQNITAAMELVTSNFGAEAASMFATLPAEVQAQLGAALAANKPQAVLDFWSDFLSNNDDLLQEQLLRMLLLAPATASTLTEGWESFFNNELVPIFEEAGGIQGSEAFNEAISQMFPALMLQVGEQAPILADSIAAMLNVAAEEAAENIDPAKVGQVVEILTSDLTTAEKLQALVDMGITWADAIALGFGTLPRKLGDVAVRGAGEVNRRMTGPRGIRAESPSKMSMEWAENIAAGFQLGLDRHMPSAVSSMFRMMQAPVIVNTPAPSVTGPSITINNPTHRSDDVLSEVKRAATLVGLTRAAETTPGFA